MVLPKSKKNVGLGKGMIRSRFKNGTRPTDFSTTLHTTELDDGPKWTKLQSITQEGDLEEFLHSAELADTDFTAERQNVTVVSDSYKNPFLLTAEEEKNILQKQQENKDRLTIPRRPVWNKEMSASVVNRNEQKAFLDWRRSLAMLQEVNGLLLTPYERNLEVWRQLWRVVERSQLVVQIVDARNPLFFRSVDVDRYVKEVGSTKKNLLLINKADLLTYSQRKAWADYFDSEDIDYAFFSAAIATARQEAEALRASLETLDLEKAPSDSTGLDEDALLEKGLEHDAKNPARYHELRKDTAEEDPRLQIKTCGELIDLFHVKGIMPLPGEIPHNSQHYNKLTVGLIGYPNVGKSSTINSLMGEKCVAVAATPGKTKHFQTLHLDESLVLCDCPGLVFPSFVTTQAEMVCNGVLPIDQLREHTAPSELVAKRIPKYVLEAIYGIIIPIKSPEEGGTGIPTAEELLRAYAVSRGYTKSSEGNPDEARAARYILKDFVKGKLLYNVPPPGFGDPLSFNEEIYDPERLPKRKVHIVPPTSLPAKELVASSLKTLDGAFFNKNLNSIPRTTGKFANNFNRVQLYPHHSTVGPDGTPLTAAPTPSKNTSKMHKKPKRHVKQRSGYGLD